MITGKKEGSMLHPVVKGYHQYSGQRSWRVVKVSERKRKY